MSDDVDEQLKALQDRFLEEGESGSRQDVCMNCAFWVNAIGKGLHAGDCRRFPPVIKDGASLGQKHSSFWPTTIFYEWCGEFRKRP